MKPNGKRRQRFPSRPGRGLAAGLVTLAVVLGHGGAAFAGEGICREPRGAAEVRVACLGDSNTQSDWQINRPDGFPTEEGWCERLASLVTTLNCGWGGATASPNTGYPFQQGQVQLDEALADPDVDLVVLAFGTNDVGYSFDEEPGRLLLENPTVEAIVDEIEGLALDAEAAGALVLVSTSPHRFPPTDEQYPSGPEGFNDRIDELNAEIVARFPAEVIVDFTSDFAADDFLSDGLHVNSGGMAKRAGAALEGIVRLVPEPARGLPMAALLALGFLRRRRRLPLRPVQTSIQSVTSPEGNTNPCPPGAVRETRPGATPETPPPEPERTGGPASRWSSPRLTAGCGPRTDAGSCSPSPASC